MPAWLTRAGIVRFGKAEPRDAQRPLHLPCGRCLGCRTANAKAWALRCQLELQDHKHATFTTLTYSEPPTCLVKRDLQLFLKRLRRNTAQPVRFFAAGEYGEKNYRPHYHALLFGLSAEQSAEVDKAWSLGFTKTVNITPAAIAYTAGYCAKKIGCDTTPHQLIDPRTGETTEWQPPFIQMSRKPGIGSPSLRSARGQLASWRNYAVLNGTLMPVPRYLHNAWRQQATHDEIEQLEYEKSLTRHEKPTETQLAAQEQIAITKQALQAERRQL